MSKKTWEFKQLADNPDLVNLYVYGDIESDSYDWWWDETIESETSANHFKNELERYSQVKEINLYIQVASGLEDGSLVAELSSYLDLISASVNMP